MKTLSIQNENHPMANPLSRALSTNPEHRYANRVWPVLLAIVLPGLALVLSSWAALNDFGNVLNATSWLTGLVFLALALESNCYYRALLLSITGLVQMAIAALGQMTVPEWGILSSLVTAIWAVYALLEHRADSK